MSNYYKDSDSASSTNTKIGARSANPSHVVDQPPPTPRRDETSPQAHRKNENARSRPPARSDPIAHTIPDVMGMIRVGRTKIYELIKRKELRAVKIGRATRILNSDLRAFLTTRRATNDNQDED